MNRRMRIKNPALFAIISFVLILGVSFMLVFSAVASSRQSDKEAADKQAAAEIETAQVPETTEAETVAKTISVQPEEIETEAATETAVEEENDEVFEADADDEAEAVVDEDAEEEYEEEYDSNDYETEDSEEEYEEEYTASLASVDYAYAVTTDQVNFRDAPDGDVIYVLYAGSAHELIDVEDGWAYIYVDGFGYGYVSADYVYYTDDAEISSEAEIRAASEGAAAAGDDGAADDEQEYSYAVTTDQINFRAEPDGDIICVLPTGSAHELISVEDGWTYIYVDGFGYGYVSSDFVYYTNDAEITPEADITVPNYEEPAEDEYVEDEQEEEYVDNSDPYASLRQEIVDYACSFAGWLPYVWGSQSLVYGADCSGFTSAVYATFGYSLSADSEVQSCQGYSVPVSEILPGDIIVYSGHVAMYVGDGLKVHSPYPGTVVTIDSMYYSTILDVRRIIG